MFRIMVRTSWGFGVELQSRIIQFFQANLACVETHDRVFADQGEELAARFLASTKILLISERFEHPGLLRGSEAQERIA